MKSKKINKFLLIMVIIVASVFTVGCKKDDDNKNNNKQTVWTEEKLLDLSVRDYQGSNGVVAAANPYAAKAGLDVLQAGGNAFDAAVAVSFALGVVEPNASGIGGGGIMTAYEASTGNYISYNFREFVPAAGTAARYGTAEALDDYALSTGVPTQVAGLVRIQAEHGALKGDEGRKTVLAPAIDYAKNGVKVTPELASTISSNFNSISLAGKEALRIFTIDGNGMDILEEGSLMVNTNYGNVLEEIANKGVDGFYTGWVADAIVNSMQKTFLSSDATAAEIEQAKGIITYDDLLYARDNYPIKETPVSGTFKGYEIVSATTPSSGGIVLLETLNMLEVWESKNGKDLSSLSHNSAEYINVISTAMQLAYGDKRKYIGDSKFVNVPISGLISKEYAAERWQNYTKGQAYLGRFQGDNDYGDPWKYVSNTSVQALLDEDNQEHYSTTSFSVADKDGNIVSVTQTINHFFGNHIVPENTGFFLNNQLSSFSLTTTSASYVEPYKQPVSHIMPTIVLKDGNPVATLGSPGSMRIPSAVIQVLLNIIEFDMDIQSAIAAPRVYSYACASDDLSSTSKDLYVEKAIPQSVIDELIKMNYNVIPTGDGDIDLYFGGVQGITFEYVKNLLHGGADPRRDGKAIGY